MIVQFHSDTTSLIIIVVGVFLSIQMVILAPYPPTLTGSGMEKAVSGAISSGII